MMSYTCSDRSSKEAEWLKEDGFDRLKEAELECSRRVNCTAVRTNYCSAQFGDDFGDDDEEDLHYEFCNNNPAPVRYLATTTQRIASRICVYKKIDGNGTFDCIMQ